MMSNFHQSQFGCKIIFHILVISFLSFCSVRSKVVWDTYINSLICFFHQFHTSISRLFQLPCISLTSLVMRLQNMVIYFDSIIWSWLIFTKIFSYQFQLIGIIFSLHIWILRRAILCKIGLLKERCSHILIGLYFQPHRNRIYIRISYLLHPSFQIHF